MNTSSAINCPSEMSIFHLVRALLCEWAPMVFPKPLPVDSDPLPHPLQAGAAVMTRLARFSSRAARLPAASSWSGGHNLNRWDALTVGA